MAEKNWVGTVVAEIWEGNDSGYRSTKREARYPSDILNLLKDIVSGPEGL